MKSLKYSILISIVLGQFAFAGVVHGGGGSAVVCRDVDGSIQSAELLDLFEARSKGLKLVPEANLAASYGLFMDRWIGYNGGVGADESETLLYNHINDFLSKAFITGPGQKLPRLNDFTTGPIPQGCAFEQLAIFDDSEVRLFIDREIWNALNNQNRAALIGHELIYRNDRMLYGYSDSNKTRELVGRFFSTTPPSKRSR